MSDNNDDVMDDVQSTQKIAGSKILTYGFIGFVFLLIVILLFSCGPRKGTMQYGICKSFLELVLPYPHTIKSNIVEQYSSAVRIYFTHTDAFGEYRLNMIECAFANDEFTGQGFVKDIIFDNFLDIAEIEPIKGNRYKVKQEILDEFNVSIPAIAASEPDLTLPPRMPDTLRGLKDR